MNRLWKSATASLTASLLAATVSSSAFAGPPPLSEEELFELADVVVEVESVGIACMGNSVETEWSIQRSYESELQPLELLKGDISMENVLQYRVTSTEYTDEAGLPGCSSPEYVLPEGWVGTVYLMEQSDGTYAISEWGGADKDMEQSVTHAVPSCDVASPSDKDPGDPGDPNDPNDDPTDSDDTEIDDEMTVQPASCTVSSVPASGTTGWMALGLAGAALAIARRRNKA